MKRVRDADKNSEAEHCMYLDLHNLSKARKDFSEN